MAWLIQLLLSFFGSMAKEATSAIIQQASKPDTVKSDPVPFLDSMELDGTDIANLDGLGTDLSMYGGLQLS